MTQTRSSNTSWSPVAKWYGELVGDSGHYFHSHVIFPRLRSLLAPDGGESVLDVGCGQGVYARTLDPAVTYVGIDTSPALIKQAQSLDNNSLHQYFTADATISLPVPSRSFDHAVSVLALQNMRAGAAAIGHMAHALKPGGDLTLVLNHPCFRIPRQSSWGVDVQNQLEYRRINRYLSPLKIPINAHPNDKSSPVTWSFHQPLEYYFRALSSSGLAIVALEEWASDKTSTGKASKRENRARAEFPLFLALQATKLVE